MRTLDSNIFVNVVCKDVIDIVNFLHQKLKDKGLDDPVELKMKRIEKECVERKNKKYKQLLDSARSSESSPSKGIFEYSALNKIADIIERKEPQVSLQNLANQVIEEERKKKKPKDQDQDQEEINADKTSKKAKKLKMKEVSYQI